MEASDRGGAEVGRNTGADHEVQVSDVVNILPFVMHDELYNKCLFKTISLHQLKLELIRRNISYLFDDSYDILTIKLRVQILKDSKTTIQLFGEV